MKIRLLYALFLTTLALVLLPANRNGRATVSGAGNTGAPGDEANANGTPRTCQYCHSNGSIQSATTITVLDTDGMAVTEYVPGGPYTVRVAIATLAGNPLRYGFQLIGLRDGTNQDLDGFSDPGSLNNYKLATIANGRTYAEQNTASTAPTFEVEWTAPPAGTGPVTFYAAGNAVNNNQLSTGDGPSHTTLHLVEALASAALEPAGLRIGAFPTLLSDRQGTLHLTVKQGGEYHIRVFDWAGRPCWSMQTTLHAGLNALAVPVVQWPNGLLVLTAESAGRRTAIQLVKS